MEDPFNVSSPVVLTYNCAVCRGGGWGLVGADSGCWVVGRLGRATAKEISSLSKEAAVLLHIWRIGKTGLFATN